MNITERAAKVLQQIDDALALAEKATPGPWIADNRGGCCATYPANRVDDTNGCHSDHERNIHYSDRGAFCEKGATGGWTMDEQSQADNSFIAASRTLLPKSLRSLKTAIEGLLVGIDARNGRDFATAACENALTTICDQWEVGQ